MGREIHVEGQSALVQVWNRDHCDYLECTIEEVISAVDRDYRLNVKLGNGVVLRGCAPECVIHKGSAGLDIDPETLEYAWSADIELSNGMVIPIWWTAWAMRKGSNPKILSISSDYPRFEISKVYSAGCIKD